MKIAHLISQYLPSIGGAQVCIHNTSLEFIKRNIQVVVITTTEDATFYDYGYPIVRISKWYLKLLKYPSIGKYFLWFKLNSLQKKYGFDLWQVTVGYPLGAYAVEFFKKNNIPCVLRCCGEDIQINNSLAYGYRISPHVDKVVKESYPRYDGLVALTESVKEEYKNLKIPDEKISVIPNGVNLQRFIRKESKNAIKIRLGLKNKIVLLTIGRNHTKKGYKLIPHIYKKLYEKRKDIVWVIIGKECSESIYPGLTDEIKERLILLEEIGIGRDGTSPDLPPDKLLEYYHGADIFVFPSYIETFGMVLIEANAAGLPVITSDVPGCRDVIKNRYNGLLAEPGNPEMFAERILSLLNDDNLYNQMLTNISENTGRYDWVVISNQYRRLYEKVIQGINSFRKTVD